MLHRFAPVRHLQSLQIPSDSVSPLASKLARLPGPVRQALRHTLVAARVTSDRRSLRTYVRLARIAHHEGSDGRAVGLRLRPLGGRTVLVRPSTSDVDTVWGTFARGYHRPPPELGGRRLELIFDLGANIGLTMADLAVRFPETRIVGVELDEDNVLLARANLAPWRERCELVHGAAWIADTPAFYAPLSGPVTVPAFSLGTLLDRHARGRRVDYMKIDVEGAESALLREAVEWASRVDCINVEVHDPYRVDECEQDLKALGFHTRADPRHRGCVIGIRAGG
jgi:hypothetical protein